MASYFAPNQLTFSPQTVRENLSVDRVPAAPGAVQRFERLMFSPAAQASAAGNSMLERSGLHNHFQALSQRWEAGQNSLQRMMDAGKYTSKELIQTQIQMINCALDVEVSSKCASMFENGVQTLIQRGG